jgi:type VI secretion system secreted protein Hcp
MAFDSYMQFIPATSSGAGTPLPGESQVKLNLSGDTLANESPALQQGNVFEIDDFSFDIEQVLNIGSQSSGAGAGKVTFNPFSITRKTDRASPIFFMMCCAGQHFYQVTLCLRRAGGGATGAGGTSSTAGSATMTSGTTFLRFDFALVAVKTISWSGSDGDESPKEEVTFEYGALMVWYLQQSASGGAQGSPVTGAWNRVYNNNDFQTISAS